MAQAVPEPSNAPAFELTNASKAFPAPDGSLRWALHPTSFTVAAGETVAIVGRSGSGKSTLLHLMAGIETPTAGSVKIEGKELSSMSDRARSLVRRDRVGLVFQFFHLIPHLTVAENVQLPAMIAGDPASHRRRGIELLERVGLADRAGDPVDQLSGGEMQRVAICRALLREPAILLADEPTGNLDDTTGRIVMDLMSELVDEHGLTLVYVTHSEELATSADRILHLKSGSLD